MSIRLIADVLDHVHDLPHVSKLVLICMADYADSNGECWPSFQTIANRSDITRRHVIRVVDGLEKAGYLTKVSVRPYKPTTYRICVRTSDVVMSLVTEETLVTARSLGSDSTVTSTSDTAMSPEPPIEPPKNRHIHGFDDFWALYPNKKAKRDCQKAWEKIVTDDDTFKAIMRALPSHVRSDSWKKEGGKYIPYPAKWLRQGMWEDEISNPSRSPRLVTAG